MEGRNNGRPHISAYPAQEVDQWRIADMQLQALKLLDEAKRQLARGNVAGSDKLLAQAQALAAEAIEMQEAEKRKRML